MRVPRKRDDNWIDGLRGIASFVVVTGHLCTSFAPDLHYPALGPDGERLLFQWPILRLCVGGRGAVAIFFFITGFVNSLSTVKNTRADNFAAGFKNLSRASFTRLGQLVFPTSIAIFITWLLCGLGAFSLAERADSDWIASVSHLPTDGFLESLPRLCGNLILFWHTGRNDYDDTHWTLPHFLVASFRIYVVVLALALVARRYWYCITILLYLYAWLLSDNMVGMNIFAGLFLAQLHIDLGPRATSILPKPVPFAIIILGLCIWSYPEHNAEWASWSQLMDDLGSRITPEPTDLSRFWVSIGTTILMFGVFFSHNARRFLSMPLFNFLGRCSFPVYLLHNSLIRSVLVWAVYGPSAAHAVPLEDAGFRTVVKRVPTFALMFILPLFYALLYLVAFGWTLYVDPLCARVIDGMKNRMFKEQGNGSLLGKPELPLFHD